MSRVVLWKGPLVKFLLRLISRKTITTKSIRTATINISSIMSARRTAFHPSIIVILKSSFFKCMLKFWESDQFFLTIPAIILISICVRTESFNLTSKFSRALVYCNQLNLWSLYTYDDLIGLYMSCPDCCIFSFNFKNVCVLILDNSYYWLYVHHYIISLIALFTIITLSIGGLLGLNCCF